MVSGWQVVVVPSPVKVVSVERSWDALLQIADSAYESGVHILAFHSKIQDRREYEDAIYGRHRLVWLDKEKLRSYGSSEFTEYIQNALDFESKWRELIRPSSVRDALVLPEQSFEPDGLLKDTWIRAQRIVEGRDSLAHIQTPINSFRSKHYSNGVWHDRAGLIFDPGGPRHGGAEAEWRWKFTYQVPAQFHYDVHGIGNRAFRVRDRFGVAHFFNEYTNVDCHGFIRGGR